MATSETRNRAPDLSVMSTQPVLKLPSKAGLRVSPAMFWKLCIANPDLRLERTAQGRLIVMAPAGAGSSGRNARLTARLCNWAEADGTGEPFDSSVGFTLPSGALRSPDASWIHWDRWRTVPLSEREVFPKICPDFVVELRSPSDSPPELRRKMVEYIDQGVRLGWLIDPMTGMVEISRPGRAVEILQRPSTLSGEDVLPGFMLDLRGILVD